MNTSSKVLAVIEDSLSVLHDVCDSMTTDEVQQKLGEVIAVVRLLKLSQRTTTAKDKGEGK